MNFNDYQHKAHSFATYGFNPMYPILGLTEEVGEVCGKIAKYIRKHNGAEPDFSCTLENVTDVEREDNEKYREAIEKELGDVLWMLSEVATIHGFLLGDIAQKNINKLTDRKHRGVIVGEGDDR
jgi:NTP pyrophosphatase (non-canonical NTP hydrolase)